MLQNDFAAMKKTSLLLIVAAKAGQRVTFTE
jgi:hypothetical protein